MSDVEAVSLPAALDVDQNPLTGVKKDASGPSSPKKPEVTPTSPSQRTCNGSNGLKQVDSEEEEPEGPPSPRADSEAETIIQSGRESLSPEKKRKHIRHDPILHQTVDGVDGSLHKKPRINSDRGDRSPRRPRGSRSPSPSHRDTSPHSVVKVENTDDSQSVTKDVLTESNANEADRPRSYRKRSFSDSVDEKRERRRDSNPNSTIRDLKHNESLFPRPASNARSVSPTRSSHKRSASGSQLPPKKKAPTPLTGFQRQSSEDRQSTSSSASGSPMPSTHLRRLGSGVGASASPAKQMGPKKLRDKSGRTPLARACADRKYDQVVMRHRERPEDLNVPDNAGNTPLQIASLNGEGPIVKFLLGAGCEINTKNIDKDTPLIDAVENGNVEVVKLLLEAGANPRTVNASGDEPYELVPTDLEKDEYDEIRKALADAKANLRPSRRSEEQIGPDTKVSSRRASVASPSRSPPPLGGGPSNRRKTGRSEITRNDLLWTQATSENLRDFAAKGDEVGVVSILNILQKADNASLIAAAKGGHHDVLSLMYAMGDADADPSPLRGAAHKAGYDTPMLAAIGRGNSDVIRLILSQPGFNPTRRLFEDRTYYELSRARQGEDWEEEYDILKAAYEAFPGSDKNRKDLASPRRARGKEKEDKRSARRESSSPVARQRKSNESPNVPRPRSAKEVQQLKEKRREKEKARELARPKSSTRDGSDALITSDHDSGRIDSGKLKTGFSTRRGSESSGVARSEEVKKRRLIAGRRPQDRDRRPSLFSSDSLSGREEAPRSRNDTDSNASLKRIRADDVSPERSRSGGAESDRVSPERKKKRRVISEEKSTNVPNGGSRKQEDSGPAEKSQARRLPEDSTRGDTRKSSHPSKKPDQNNDEPPAEKSGPVKTEPQEPVASSVADVSPDQKREEQEAEARRELEAKKAEDERVAELQRREAELEAERARLAQEEADRAGQAARAKAEQEERKRKEAEQRRAKQAEDERQKRMEQERARLLKIRRDQETQEKRRREALPGRLRVSADFVGSNDPRARSHAWLTNFMPLVTATTQQLDSTSNGNSTEEKWIPNYLVAPLLATNDLQLSQYASWEKRKATPTQRMNLWRCTRRMLVYTDDPKYRNASFGDIMQLDCDTRPKYFEMEHVFWVRLSDFMDLVPHIPHLSGLDLNFLSMHIDPEPVATPAAETTLLNGYSSGATPSEMNGSAGLNGHSLPQPGTYL